MEHIEKSVRDCDIAAEAFEAMAKLYEPTRGPRGTHIDSAAAFAAGAREQRGREACAMIELLDWFVAHTGHGVFVMLVVGAVLVESLRAISQIGRRRP